MAGKSKATLGMAPDDDWKVESDLRSLMEAEQVRRDPKRLAKAQALAKRKMVEAAAVAGGAADKD
jgi:pyocin large subunit-like protein